MKSCVIYARYSSGKQREASIEDQLRVCRDWCKANGITVVREYWDKALSGRTDRRPWFQAMVRNAPESDLVVVYAMDRFSRDQYDAPIYKKALADEGVRVVSATESIDSSPEGVFMEKVMEGWAAYYSLNLSRSVMRGMTGNAMKCKANGVPVVGYRIGSDGCYEVDGHEAEMVRQVFDRYTKGETLNSIASDLARKGFKSPRGNPISMANLYTMVHNRKYIGEYKWGDVVVPGGMPAIVDEGTFLRAQRTVPQKRRKDEEWAEYRLTGKLWCGICGKPMRGVSGRSGTGRKYDYYKCPTKGCCKGAPKGALERSIVAGVEAMVKDPKVAHALAVKACGHVDSSAHDAEIAAMEANLREARNGIRNIEDAICKGLFTDGLKERLDGFQETVARLEPEIARMREESEEVSVEIVEDFLLNGLGLDDSSLILDSFINKIVLYEDNAALTMMFTGEKGEPAEFSLMGGEFALLESGRPPLSGEEPDAYLVKGGIAIIIPVSRSSSPSPRGCSPSRTR